MGIKIPNFPPDLISKDLFAPSTHGVSFRIFYISLLIRELELFNQNQYEGPEREMKSERRNGVVGMKISAQ